MAVQGDQTLAAFVVDNDAVAKRLLKKVQQIDKVDQHVRIIDAAIVHKAKFGRVKVHQTEDTGGMHGGIRGEASASSSAPSSPAPLARQSLAQQVACSGGVHNRMRDVGINDKFMKQVGSQVEKGQSALFVMYEGIWDAVHRDNPGCHPGG